MTTSRAASRHLGISLALCAALGCGSGTGGADAGGDGGPGNDTDGGPGQGPIDAGLACSSGTCPNGLTCCSDFCTDISLDRNNCGQCGTVCDASELCTGTACIAATFQNICVNPNVIVIQDQVGDIDAGAELGAALASGCSPTVNVQSMLQTSATGVLNPSTGAPLGGTGQLLVAAGGPDVQMLVSYLEAGPSPVYYSSTNTLVPAFVDRSTGATLASIPMASVTPTHDIFLLELVVDPVSGVLSFVCYGVDSSGTAAGAWYFQHNVLAAASSAMQHWMIIEWTAQAGGVGPAQGDTFEVVASG